MQASILVEIQDRSLDSVILSHSTLYEHHFCNSLERVPSQFIPLPLRQALSLADMNQKTTRPIQKLAKAVSQCSVEVRNRVACQIRLPPTD